MNSSTLLKKPFNHIGLGNMVNLHDHIENLVTK